MKILFFLSEFHFIRSKTFKLAQLMYIEENYRPTKSFMDFLFFFIVFPQLVAGPIVRASDFIPQIYEKLKLTKEDFNRALFLIIGGFVKKAVISDYISSNFC